MKRAILFAALLVVSTALACSGPDKTETTEQPVETTATESPDETEVPDQAEIAEAPDQGEGIPFGEKSHEQQKAFMKHTVTPKMGALFTAFDGEKFAEVKCTTCHGPGAKEGEFEMPSEDLPKLTDWEKLEAEEPEMMTFMKETVVPEMATLLGEKPYNPETKQGFGCAGCHMME